MFPALKYRSWMSLSRVISNANNSDNARATPSDAAPAFSYVQHRERALHFTISPVIARSYVDVYVRTKIRTYTCDRGFHTAEDEIHPVYAPHIRGEYILRRGPPTHYLRSLLMARHDPPRRTPHIFLSSRNLYTSYSNKSRFGSSMRVDVCTFSPRYLVDACITSAIYDRVSLNNMMKPMLFN